MQSLSPHLCVAASFSSFSSQSYFFLTSVSKTSSVVHEMLHQSDPSACRASLFYHCFYKDVIKSKTVFQADSLNAWTKLHVVNVAETTLRAGDGHVFVMIKIRIWGPGNALCQSSIQVQIFCSVSGHLCVCSCTRVEKALQIYLMTKVILHSLEWNSPFQWKMFYLFLCKRDWYVRLL